MIKRWLITLPLLLLPAASAVADDQQERRGPPPQYTYYPLGSGALIGAEGSHAIEDGETLFSIARDHSLGFRELVAANPDLDAWQPEVGRTLRLPNRHLLPEAPREGIVVDLAQRRLFYFPPEGDQVLTWPVSIGQQGHDTPLGQTRVVRKRVDPTWVPPPSVREKFEDLPASVPPGDSNPLGTRALDLGWPSYVIHGTNLAMGVGGSLSHGCVRMHNRDVEMLYELVETDILVTVVDQPVRLGWHENGLWMQVSPDWDKLDARGRATDTDLPDRTLPMLQLLELAGERTPELDWDAIGAALLSPHGSTVQLLSP